MESKKINRRSALVTGGSRGIGRAVSRRLARDGFHVVINFRSNQDEAESLEREIKDAGGDCELYPFDVTDRTAVAEAIEDITTEHILEVLVLCAGVRNDELLIFMSDEQWDSVMDTSLSGFFNVVKPVVTHMMQARKGRIISVAGIAGELGEAGRVNYSAAEAGLIGATKALAREGAKRGVLVNAVSPGFVDIDADEHVEPHLLSRVPLGRYGTADDIAGVVSFLAGPDAAYITGQVIGVNGGLHM